MATLVLMATLDRANEGSGSETFKIDLESSGTITKNLHRSSLVTNIAAGPDATNNGFNVQVNDASVVSMVVDALRVSEDAGIVGLTVTIFPVRAVDTRLSIRTDSVSASDNADFTPGPFSLTIPASEGTAMFQVLIIEDQTDEADEGFSVIVADQGLPDDVALDQPDGPGTLPMTLVPITDSDATEVALTMLDMLAMEGRAETRLRSL